LIAAIVSSLAFKLLMPELPFIDRVGWVFVLCIATGIILMLTALYVSWW
jgi:SSS family solute:Na+ symporter